MKQKCTDFNIDYVDGNDDDNKKNNSIGNAQVNIINLEVLVPNISRKR